jgi:hypothetical protein
MQNVVIWKGLCDCCVSVWGQEPHIPHLLHTVYAYAVVYLFTGGGGGVELNQRAG